MKEIVNKAFLEELEILEPQMMEKEAILGVKALMMGARRLGSGIAGKAKAGLIKAQVGVQKAHLGVSKGVQKAVAGPSRTAGGQFAPPGKIKKFFRQEGILLKKDTSKLEASIAANTAKAQQTSQIAGAKIKGTGTAVKRTWGVEKQDTSAMFRNIKRKRGVKQRVKMKRDTQTISGAEKSAPKPIDTKAKMDTKASKPTTDQKATAKKKKQPILDVVGASLVGGESKYKTLAGGAALAGGGYMAANILGGKKKKKPVEQGIFFKSSELNKTASLGGTTLGAITKEANPKMKALKLVGGGAALGAGAASIAKDAFEPDGDARMKGEAKDAFRATFPNVPPQDADNMFEQVWLKYKKNQHIQTTKAVIQGASEAQKFGSFSDELSKEASIAAIGKIVAKIGYSAGRALAGGKHLGHLTKAKKLTQLQRVGMSAMKNRKLVGTGIVAGGAGYLVGGRNKA